MCLFKQLLLFKTCLCIVLTIARYGGLLAQRDVNLPYKEQVVTLLESIGAEDTQYQLGLTKVQQNKAFLLGQAHISIVYRQLR